MAPPIIGFFEQRTAAELAIGALAGRSFRRDQISVVRREWLELSESPVDANAGLGGLGVLLVDAVPLAIPAIGTVLAVGPLVDAMCSARPAPTGTSGGALHGALVYVGCTNGQAGAFSEGVRRGGTLVVVHAAAEQAGDVRAVLRWALTADPCTGIPASPDDESCMKRVRAAVAQRTFSL